MRGMALCAGVGGLEGGIGLAVPRYRTVCYVEREAYAAACLVARMEDGHRPATDTTPNDDSTAESTRQPGCSGASNASAGWRGIDRDAAGWGAREMRIRASEELF